MGEPATEIGQEEGALYLNLGEACEVADMAEQTLKGHMKDPDFPDFEGGSNGVPYRIPAEAFAAWLQAHQEKLEAEKRARADQIQDLFSFMAPDGAEASASESDARPLSPTEIHTLGQARLTFIKAQKEEGLLVLASDVRRRNGQAVVELKRELLGLPKQLTDLLSLEREQRLDLEAKIEGILDRFADRLGALDEKDTDPNAAAVGQA